MGQTRRPRGSKRHDDVPNAQSHCGRTEAQVPSVTLQSHVGKHLSGTAAVLVPSMLNYTRKSEPTIWGRTGGNHKPQRGEKKILITNVKLAFYLVTSAVNTLCRISSPESPPTKSRRSHHTMAQLRQTL